MSVYTIRTSCGNLFNGYHLASSPIKVGDYIVGVKFGESFPTTHRIAAFGEAPSEAGLGITILAIPARSVVTAITKQVDKEPTKDELKALIRAKMVDFNEEAIWNIVASRKVEIAKLVDQYNKLK